MQWIKCSEKLPEEGKDVLVYSGRLNIDNIPQYDIAAYREYPHDSFFVSGPYQLSGITHWMSLPESPKD